MNGVIVIDKPEGMTSHDVVALARRHFREQRIGHTGTLDPLATGVLPLACGRATRLVRFLTASTKVYEATIRFGVTTDSYDITGAETGRTGRAPAVSDVEAALVSLRGEYLQMPPAFSARKVGGRRAYTLARDGQPVALAPSRVRVSQADLLDLAGDVGRFAITCSAGFYVRSFAQAIGALTGVGACLQALRRTRSGQFDVHGAVAVASLAREPQSSRGFVPMNALLPHLPAVQVSAEGEQRVTHGRELLPEHRKAVSLDGGNRPADGEAEAHAGERWVRILDTTGQLIAMGRMTDASHDVLHPSVVLI